MLELWSGDSFNAHVSVQERDLLPIVMVVFGLDENVSELDYLLVRVPKWLDHAAFTREVMRKPRFLK